MKIGSTYSVIIKALLYTSLALLLLVTFTAENGNPIIKMLISMSLLILLLIPLIGIISLMVIYLFLKDIEGFIYSIAVVTILILNILRAVFLK